MIPSVLEGQVSYLSRLHYHRNAASREEKAADRAVDRKCAKIHEDLATMHRGVAAQLEGVYISLRQAFGDVNASVPAPDESEHTATRTTPERRWVVSLLTKPDWPSDMG